MIATADELVMREDYQSSDLHCGFKELSTYQRDTMAKNNEMSRS
jgi:hypothetical protein